MGGPKRRQLSGVRASGPVTARVLVATDDDGETQALVDGLQVAFPGVIVEAGVLQELDRELDHTGPTIVVVGARSEAAAAPLLALNRGARESLTIVALAPADLADEIACLRHVHRALPSIVAGDHAALEDAVQTALGVVLAAAS